MTEAKAIADSGGKFSRLRESILHKTGNSFGWDVR